MGFWLTKLGFYDIRAQLMSHEVLASLSLGIMKLRREGLHYCFAGVHAKTATYMYSLDIFLRLLWQFFVEYRVRESLSNNFSELFRSSFGIQYLLLSMYGVRAIAIRKIFLAFLPKMNGR